MSERKQELRIAPRRENLAVARRFVAEAAGSLHLAPQQFADLQVAVSEACTNAIDAHEASGVAAAIVIRCTVSDRAVEVVICDHGGGFDPNTEIELPATDDPRRLQFENGLGLSIMRAFSDWLEITRHADGTAVHLGMRAVG